MFRIQKHDVDNQSQCQVGHEVILFHQQGKQHFTDIGLQKTNETHASRTEKVIQELNIAEKPKLKYLKSKEDDVIDHKIIIVNEDGDQLQDSRF